MSHGFLPSFCAHRRAGLCKRKSHEEREVTAFGGSGWRKAFLVREDASLREFEGFEDCHIVT